MNNYEKISEINKKLVDDESKLIFSSKVMSILTGDSSYQKRYIKTKMVERYFDIFIPEADEVFVDCGCFDGSDIVKFVKWCGSEYKNIYAFEINTDNYNEIIKDEEISKFDRCCITNCGVWNKNGQLNIDGNGMNTKVSVKDNKNINRCKVVSLDNELGEKPVSFIKMDIEDAELMALEGAKKIISKYRPKLAICVYHRNKDIIDIPSYILSINSEYKFILRHYTFANSETVLYCY